MECLQIATRPCPETNLNSDDLQAPPLHSARAETACSVGLPTRSICTLDNKCRRHPNPHLLGDAKQWRTCNLNGGRWFARISTTDINIPAAMLPHQTNHRSHQVYRCTARADDHPNPPPSSRISDSCTTITQSEEDTPDSLHSTMYHQIRTMHAANIAQTSCHQTCKCCCSHTMLAVSPTPGKMPPLLRC
jgi:hypothetical protein